MYYIEDCQLCLFRGQFHSCGWCNDIDSSTGDGQVQLSLEDCGYPFHNRPHESRKYFNEMDEHIPELDGKKPNF